MIDVEEGQNLEVLGENEDSNKSMVASKDQHLMKPDEGMVAKSSHHLPHQTKEAEDNKTKMKM